MRRASSLVGPLLLLAALGARATLPLAALGLAGCPPAPGSTAKPTSASTSTEPSAAPAVVFSDCDFADLSGIEVGQRWTYELDGGVLELILTVLEVSRSGVVFTETTHRTIQGVPREAVGHNRVLEWGWSPTRPGERPYQGLALERHAIVTAAGPRELTGILTAHEGDQVLFRVVDGRPVWPGELSVERGGRVIRRLVRID